MSDRRTEINQLRAELLRAKLAEARKEIEEYESSAELRRKAEQRAVDRWRKATGRQMARPDHASLCVWLLEQLELTESYINGMNKGLDEVLSFWNNEKE